MRRRDFLWLSLAGLAGVRVQAAGPEPVRFGLTPVFLDDQASFLRAWHAYLESRLGRGVQFVRRGTYREISDMLRQDKLDFAWICGYPYVRLREMLRLLAVPVYRGQPLYRSYLIVPAGDRTTQSILDLRGKVFAFSDPDSNSGYLYANYRLAQAQERPAEFFSRSFFTWGHRNVVGAVASGLAHGGSVDGYVWDTLGTFDPEQTGRTRVADRSPEFGFPPIVARRSIARDEFDAMGQVLLGMEGDAQGRRLLAQLNLDGFVKGSDSLFTGIEAMMMALDRFRHAATT